MTTDHNGVPIIRTDSLLTVIVVLLFISIGAAIYEVYDLVFPNRFVGDMYGLEVLMRSVVLGAPVFLLFLGGLFCLVRIARNKRPGLLGLTFLVIATVVLAIIAVNTAWNRHLTAGREHVRDSTGDVGISGMGDQR